jgi:hypothetical protein
VLQRGDNGEAVRRVQETLAAWGLPIADPPGHFEVYTEAAIYLVQRTKGLIPDGVIGPQTEALLSQGPPPGLSTLAVAALLDVPYLSQRDNEHRPLATCNVTSLAMALRYRGIAGQSPSKQFEDELFELLHSPAGMAFYAASSPDLHCKSIPPEDVLSNLVWAAEQHGASASFAEDRTLPDIEQEVTQGRPVMLSTLFTGAGHIVLLVGVCQSGDFIVHDPFGDWNHGYQSREGRARIYAREKVLQALKPVSSAEKWGLFIGLG